jgi:DNA-binding GntR family transcriptional regulator
MESGSVAWDVGRNSTFGDALEWSNLDEVGGLASRVADQLAEAIIEGRLEGGARLGEPDIARTFGISRTPAREALYILERDELVERPPRRSARVASVTEKQALDVYICRAYLYGLSARMCAPQLTKTDLAELSGIVRAMDLAVKGNDAKTYYRLNLAFHDYVGRASGNEMLLKLMGGMGRRTLRFRYMSLTIPGRLNVSLKSHHLLMREFRRYDADAAEKRVRQIVSSAGDAVLLHFFGNSSQAVSKEVMKW